MAMGKIIGRKLSWFSYDVPPTKNCKLICLKQEENWVTGGVQRQNSCRSRRVRAQVAILSLVFLELWTFVTD